MATTEYPKILADGQAYAIKIDNYYFSRFDQEGYPSLSRSPVCFTKEQADQIALKIDEDARAIPVRADIRGQEDAVKFWVPDKFTDGTYSERFVHINSRVRDRYTGVPGWFIAAMMKFKPDEDWGADRSEFDTEYHDDLRALDAFFSNIGHGWCDHYGWTGVGEESVFVTEPYHLDQDEIDRLIEDCKKFGFRFSLSGISIHYPSSTLRIEISPIERLVYQKREHIVSPEQKKWEADRTVAFKALVRKVCCDYIRHVAYTAEDSRSEDYLMFVDTSLNVVKDYLEDGETYDASLLPKYHALAQTKYNKLCKIGKLSTTRRVIDALVRVTAPDNEITGFTAGAVGASCQDAVDDYQMSHHKSSFEHPGYVDEMNWQHEQHKAVWDAYYDKWSNEKGPDYKEAA